MGDEDVVVMAEAGGNQSARNSNIKVTTLLGARPNSLQ